MSELDQEPEVTLEEALKQNWSAAEEDSGDVTADEQAAETEQESQDPLEPLERWTDEQKEAFRGLDRRFQEFVLERHRELEGDYTQKTQELADFRKRYQRLDEVLSPYEQALKPQGVDLAPHLGQALNYYFGYLKDPVSTVKALIQSQKLTQDQIFEDESADPDIRALRAELKEAKDAIASLRSQPQSDAQQSLNSFRDAKNEDGTLKHPHFEKLKTRMAPFVNDGMSLEDAYNEALWTLPEHRQAQLEKERKEAEAKAEKARKQKVSEAKKASGVLPSSDVDRSDGLSDFKNWEAALKETLGGS